MPDLSNIVEWASEIGDLSYLKLPDPDDTGIQIRLRVQSIKRECGAGENPAPVPLHKYMFDAVNWKAIPTDAKFVAGYIDGPVSKWSDDAWIAFPNAYKITVLGNLDADIADVESGDLTPEQGSAWYRAHDPNTMRKIYCSASVVQRIVNLGVPIEDFWVADWTGQAHIWGDSWACQFANPRFTGRDYDLSLI